MSQPLWNSLERTKLIVQALTPLTVAIVGFIFAQVLAQQNGLSERRLRTYDLVRVELNRIYCFVEEVGTWKSDDPEKIVSYKRLADQAMHTHRAIWAEDTFAAYIAYMNSAFDTYSGDGRDARIKARNSEGRQAILGWRPEWNTRLTGARDPAHKTKHDELQSLLARDLRWK